MQGHPVGWNASPDIYHVDEAVAHTGQRSLRFHNLDPHRGEVCTQPLPLKPGRQYQFSAWVKTHIYHFSPWLKKQTDVGTDSGATIALEWYDANNKFLGGSYAPGIKGDTDWTLIRHNTHTVPVDAKHCFVTLCIRGSMTGTAWFDDIEVHSRPKDPLSVVMVSPNYRGWLWPDKPAVLQVNAVIYSGDLEVAPERLGLGVAVVDKSGQIIKSANVSPIQQSTQVQMTLPSDLPAGRYQVRVALIDESHSVNICVKTDRLVKLADDFRPYSYIDEHNRLIVDGQPFFPLGCYLDANYLNAEHLRTYADSAFNCLMPYGLLPKKYLDIADEFSLKFIYALNKLYAGKEYAPREVQTQADERAFIENTVNQFANHPALLAWYLNDELPLAMLDRLIAHQEWLEELDPHHPTWTVLCQVNDVRDYARSFDAIGTDPYPIGQDHPSRAATWTRRTRRAVCGARPVWMVPQLLNWNSFHDWGRTPTADEIRSMSWQCITEGAGGLIYFSYHRLFHDPQTPFEQQWPQIKHIAAEIEKWVPVLLSVEEPLAVSVAGDNLHSIARSLDGTTYLFVVNDDYEPHTVTVKLPEGYSLKSLSDNATITANEQGELTEELGGLDMQAYAVISP